MNKNWLEPATCLSVHHWCLLTPASQTFPARLLKMLSVGSDTFCCPSSKRRVSNQGTEATGSPRLHSHPSPSPSRRPHSPALLPSGRRAAPLSQPDPARPPSCPGSAGSSMSFHSSLPRPMH
ncbi:hypothetical protein HJG60_010818 [Phyllostomus discolor]|uniref:Uncharacterized protein n=1 Tax=Phyllostomus discolor TaxID=89673 RepID=A0A834AHC7_9CHIR|nr:hypothetical protein HJG60_010818 [Phyllostomus discolor]